MLEEDKKWQNDYSRASKKVEKIKIFYTHLTAYFTVVPFLIFVNYMTFWGFHWFWFPMFGWGIGLLIHGSVTFGTGSDWEKRKIKELMDNDKNI